MQVITAAPVENEIVHVPVGAVNCNKLDDELVAFKNPLFTASDKVHAPLLPPKVNSKGVVVCEFAVAGVVETDNNDVTVTAACGLLLVAWYPRAKPEPAVFLLTIRYLAPTVKSAVEVIKL